MAVLDIGHIDSTGWLTSNSVYHVQSPNYTKGFISPYPDAICHHYTAGLTLQEARRTVAYNPNNPGNKPNRNDASAHFCIGNPDNGEGLDQWVSVCDRSWHAGKGQQLNKGHKPRGVRVAASTSIGIEVVGLGRDIAGPKRTQIRAASDDGDYYFWFAYPEKQVDLIVDVCKAIVKVVYPSMIGPDDHQGHSDYCPGRKDDPGPVYPYVDIIRRVYGLTEERYPDWWTPFRTVKTRQRALILLGFDVGKAKDDDRWGKGSADALSSYLASRGMSPIPAFTTGVARSLMRDMLEKMGEYSSVTGYLFGD